MMWQVSLLDTACSQSWTLTNTLSRRAAARVTASSIAATSRRGASERESGREPERESRRESGRVPGRKSDRVSGRKIRPRPRAQIRAQIRARIQPRICAAALTSSLKAIDPPQDLVDLGPLELGEGHGLAEPLEVAGRRAPARRRDVVVAPRVEAAPASRADQLEEDRVQVLQGAGRARCGPGTRLPA